MGIANQRHTGRSAAGGTHVGRENPTLIGKGSFDRVHHGVRLCDNIESPSSPSPSTPRTLPATPESSPFRSLCSLELGQELDRASAQSAGSPSANPKLSLSMTSEAAGTLRKSHSLNSLTTTHSLRSLSSDQRSKSHLSVGCTRHSPMLEVLQRSKIHCSTKYQSDEKLVESTAVGSKSPSLLPGSRILPRACTF